MRAGSRAAPPPRGKRHLSRARTRGSASSAGDLAHVAVADIPAIYEATAGYRAHVCNVGRATWLGVRETAQRIVDDHNRAVAWRAASATAPVALAADELAAIGARAVTYERAAQAYATASHGAPSRVRRLEMEDAAHDSAADVPALLAHIAALDALRHGADPDAATLPTRSREVTDRWGYD